jgi:hypothetical protein
VITFGCAIGSDATFAAYAAPGIARAAEPDSAVIELRDQSSIFEAYNGVLERCAARPDCEAAVLLHDDLEILDSGFCNRVRHWLGGSDVAVLGAVGARDVRSIAWWHGRDQVGRFGWRGISDADKRLGRELQPAGTLRLDWGGAGEDVDAVDGMVVVLSRWAIEELRFDEQLAPGFHGYDADICFQARERGKRVIVGDFELIHHTAARLGEREGWLRAHVAFARKWEGRLLPVDGGKAGVGAATAPGDERAQPAAFA